ncbi:MAG: hypothetical protein COV72_00085 [Candidatus Omnitrophica bacterium CG11_big_fil_rev_8_21_14_0_20_42_13]|uniref:DUF3179 domain-containing protein n=1 Tax=Candidatus Ghiorseimicrobium undicola TaxID=1974746 RepID=A0A2H0M2Q5_9BACT|nr:MAG: hypothetical protein COV72_00085 [Candidatus Omnitrophica bacterium CG11_big_fil_rev_8_21_14_0_20_42_13]
MALFGFDYSKHSIPTEQIHDGGPPKDGIPALTDPEFTSGNDAKYLGPKDRVLGISINGEAKAYPINILNWHEVVNDRVGGKDVLVSYCPLCGTGMVFDAHIKGIRSLFGVSGKLYNSDVLMYDKQTESLWSQIKMEAVTGPMTGEKLALLSARHTTWEAWRSQYPDTLILSSKTGYSRDYSRNPYAGYGQSPEIYFPVDHRDNRLPVKEWVVGVVINGQPKAYSFGRLTKEKAAVEDVIADKEITVYFDKNNESAVVKDNNGNVIPSVQAYWFAWKVFYPQTELFH